MHPAAVIEQKEKLFKSEVVYYTATVQHIVDLALYCLGHSKNLWWCGWWWSLKWDSAKWDWSWIQIALREYKPPSGHHLEFFYRKSYIMTMWVLLKTILQVFTFIYSLCASHNVSQHQSSVTGHRSSRKKGAMLRDQSPSSTLISHGRKDVSTKMFECEAVSNTITQLRFLGCVFLYFTLGAMAKNVLPRISDISRDRKTKRSGIVDIHGSFRKI